MGHKSMLAAAAFICLSLLSAHLEVVKSTEYIVGDAQGWTYNTRTWPDGKSFNASDVLVFTYSPEDHNLVVVDAAGFQSCQPSPGSPEYHSGDDRITLKQGDNFFLCSFPDHCAGYEMKILVHAA